MVVAARAELYTKNFTMTWPVDSDALQQPNPVQDFLNLWAVPVSLRGKMDDIYVSLTKLFWAVV